MDRLEKLADLEELRKVALEAAQDYEARCTTLRMQAILGDGADLWDAVEHIDEALAQITGN